MSSACALFIAEEQRYDSPNVAVGVESSGNDTKIVFIWSTLQNHQQTFRAWVFGAFVKAETHLKTKYMSYHQKCDNLMIVVSFVTDAGWKCQKIMYISPIIEFY